MSTIASFRVEVRGPVPRKNRRHIVARGRILNSREFRDFVQRLDAAWRSAGHPVINTGRWVLLVESVWDRQRHLDEGISVPMGDVDAPLSAVLDAMQEAGLLDDDVRVVQQAAEKRYGPEQKVFITLEYCP